MKLAKLCVNCVLRNANDGEERMSAKKKYFISSHLVITSGLARHERMVKHTSFKRAKLNIYSSDIQREDNMSANTFEL